VKIGDSFYDPTFDDPVGQKETTQANDYKYYQLPYDLFYTNRFTLHNLPQDIAKMTLEQRKQVVTKNLYNLLTKY
jgi:hypothetical protein